MIGEKLDARDSYEASLVMQTKMAEILGLAGVYHMEHRRVRPHLQGVADRLLAHLVDPANAIRVDEIEADLQALERDVLHAEDFRNVITTVGANLCLDTILGNSAAGAVVMGLKGTGTAVIGDTQASHAGWLEQGAANAPTYSGTRKTPTFSAAASKSKTTSAAVGFTFTGSGTVFGAFINIGGTSAIDNTTGTLFSAGDFSGSRAVVSTDVINVTYTLTV